MQMSYSKQEYKLKAFDDMPLSVIFPNFEVFSINYIFSMFCAIAKKTSIEIDEKLKELLEKNCFYV